MPSYVPPKKNTQFIFPCGLVDQSNVKLLKDSPTLAAGDVKVRTDAGSISNITTLPTATGRTVMVTLSAAEMNGDNIAVIFSDAAGDEWCDLMVTLQTSLTQQDDIPTVTEIVNEIDASSTDLNTIISNLGDLLTDISDIQTDIDTLLSTVTDIQNGLPSGIIQNQALQNFEFFMALASDGKTGATGKTITCQRSLDGGAFSAMTNAASEVAAGIYKIDLSAADTNAVIVCYKFTNVDCDATIVIFKTEVAV